MDWRNPQNDNLWQGVSGINNPCPADYRIPTEAEWDAERQSWESNNSAGAFASPLKLPSAGSRFVNGLFYGGGSNGNYWSITLLGASAKSLAFTSRDSDLLGSFRASGYSVRCIKD